jgi:APA family basic amino acid/polyamine antiporter
MCSTLGAVNASMLIGPRIYFAMARDGLLPASVRRVHGQWQTPSNAILLQCVWTIALITLAFCWQEKPGDAFDALTNYVIFGGSVFYALAVGAVFVLRRTRPDLPRPYRTWGYPVVPSLYLVFFCAVLTSLLWNNWEQCVAGTTLIAFGALVYAIARGRRGAPGP